MARHISNWELDGSAEVKASQVRAVRECLMFDRNLCDSLTVPEL